mmetsp:Transcript_18468/g.40381  ORF Transcript_18468/g.40381 Transcript_18468/m.40381 type:complete len:288 (+) Transcript_18468:273-1136(+)
MQRTPTRRLELWRNGPRRRRTRRKTRREIERKIKTRRKTKIKTRKRRIGATMKKPEVMSVSLAATEATEVGMTVTEEDDQGRRAAGVHLEVAVKEGAGRRRTRAGEGAIPGDLLRGVVVVVAAGLGLAVLGVATAGTATAAIVAITVIGEELQPVRGGDGTTVEKRRLDGARIRGAERTTTAVEAERTRFAAAKTVRMARTPRMPRIAGMMRRGVLRMKRPRRLRRRRPRRLRMPRMRLKRLRMLRTRPSVPWRRRRPRNSRKKRRLGLPRRRQSSRRSNASRRRNA